MAINFIGALNAVQKLYADKTNLMVPVGCGEDTPPTPPTPPTIESVVLQATQDSDTYTATAFVTFSQAFMNDYCSDGFEAEMNFYDANGNAISDLQSFYVYSPYECNTNVADGYSSGFEGTIPQEIYGGGTYDITVTDNVEMSTIYQGSGTWTFEDQTQNEEL